MAIKGADKIGKNIKEIKNKGEEKILTIEQKLEKLRSENYRKSFFTQMDMDDYLRLKRLILHTGMTQEEFLINSVDVYLEHHNLKMKNVREITEFQMNKILKNV